MAPSASSDEGEISDSGLSKATTTMPQYNGTSVDRQNRARSISSASKSPGSDAGPRPRDGPSRDRSRSPYSARGSKRSRDDDYYERDRSDTRRFKVHYEERPYESGRSYQRSYEDLDKDSATSSTLRYDDRDRYADKRHRTRSRSPYRAGRRDIGSGYAQSRKDGYERRPEQTRSRLHGFEEQRRRHMGDESVSRPVASLELKDLSKQEAKTEQDFSNRHDHRSRTDTNADRQVARPK